MYRLSRLSIENFNSYEQATIDFNSGCTTLIYGKNHDVDSTKQCSNGSGKSTISKAIQIALTDKTEDKFSKTDYIRNGCKKSLIELTLLNQSTGDSFSVIRTYSKNGSSVELWENYELNSEITELGVSHVNNRIIELIGVSRDELLRFFIINEHNGSSFFVASDREKKETISQFINASLVDNFLDEIKEDEKSLMLSIDDLGGEILKHDATIEEIDEQINFESKKNFKKDFERKKRVLSGNIKELRDEVEELLEEQEQMRVDLIDCNEKIESIGKKIIDVELIKKNISTVKKKSKSIDDEKLEALEILGDIQRLLSSVVECPSCGHEFSLSDHEKDLKTLRESQIQLEGLIEVYESQVKEFSLKIKSFRRKIDGNDSLISRVSIQENKIKSLNRRLRINTKQIDSVNDSINKLTESINSIDISSFEDDRLSTLKRLKKRKSSNKVKMILVNKKIKEKEAKLEVVKFWKLNMGLKGFKAYLINRFLKLIEGLINIELNRFKIDLKVKINGFKKLRNGDLREEIEVLVSRDGLNWEKYHKFSKGQRQRMNVCVILAFHKLINNNSGKGLDLLVLDEFFEGLDSQGQESVLNILTNSKITTLVISHNNNDIAHPNFIWVDYENGVSKIREDG